MQRLRQQLARLEGKGYKSYKALENSYHFPNFTLNIDHVQGDPFAEPSRMRLQLGHDRLKLPSTLYNNPVRRIALEDYLGRRCSTAIKATIKGERGSGKSGLISITPYGQQVIQRNSVLISNHSVELRIQMGLPAAGRSILAHEAAEMFFNELPRLVELLLESHKEISTITDYVNSVESQEDLRNQLSIHHLIAFIADGSTLARHSGVDDRPLKNSTPSYAPDSMAITLQSLHHGRVRGLAIPQGVTLMVGGGFHGKSTLLHALELGVYNHIPGDGREGVVCVADAVKIRAEDGRAVTDVDISMFINHLPGEHNTCHFTTNNASGSTSQAASISEALAMQSTTLLIDEDTSATNFLIRDARMQQLVATEKEPITPLVARIRQLNQELQVSVVMVMGGSGDYLKVADQVLMLDHYRVVDVSKKARQLASDISHISALERGGALKIQESRQLKMERLNPLNQYQRPRIRAQGTSILHYGDREVELGRIEQLVSSAQVDAIGYLLSHLFHASEPDNDLLIELKELYIRVNNEGLDTLPPFLIGTLAMPRLQEVATVLNRL